MPETTVSFDIFCDETRVLNDLRRGNEAIEVEFASGLGGLEIIGTLIIPGTALALQIVSLVRDLRKKSYPTLVINQIHIHVGDSHRTITVDNSTDIEAILRELP